MARILVIEDDDVIRQNILELLEMEGFEGVGADNGERGVSVAVNQQPDLIICDIAMPGIDGYEVFEILSGRPTTAVIPFIFLSARAERTDVRRGMSLGAADYITKPFTRVELLDSIGARLRRQRVVTPAQVPVTGASPTRPQPREPIIADPSMKALVEQVERIARGSISVLILGETGVGKELLAEQIHRRSGRSGPFVPINCAALSANLIESELFGHTKGAFTGAHHDKVGLFESAHGGTLFMDEVGELPSATQAKLLRVLEERKVRRVGGRIARAIDVRFVAATNRAIERAVQEGSFRQDLYFRLNGIKLTVPPLRERPGDVKLLSELFIAASCKEIGRATVPRVAEPVWHRLASYSWPGNIRELRNVMERAVLLCEGDILSAEHLPANVRSSTSPVDGREQIFEKLEDPERQRIVDALAQCGGNQTRAAALLGISRRTLTKRLDTYRLPRPLKKDPSKR